MYARSLLLAGISACLLAPAGASGADAAPVPLQVSGLVVRAKGDPASVRVALLPLQSNHSWRHAVLSGRAAPDPAATVEAGSEGRFVLTAPSAGMWSAVVTAAGRVPMRYLPLPVVDSVELPPLELVPDDGVEVQVRWKDGRPEAGAWVLLTTGSPDLLRTLRTDGWQVNSRVGRTDAAGRVKLPRVAGETVKIHAFARDARRGAATVPAGMARTEVILEPSAGSRVIEVRDASGVPLADVAVTAGNPAWPAGITSPDGELTLPTDGEGPFDLLLADGRRHRLELLPAASGAAPARIDLPVLRRLEGKVLDAASRRPLPWVLVWPGDDPGNVTFTDPRGVYTIAERPGSRAWVQAEAKGFQPAVAKRPVDAASTRMPALALEPAGTLAGHVVDAAAAPLPGVVVTVAPDRRGRDEVFRPDRAASRALSDEEGRFLLRGLAKAASYNLTASRPGYRAAQATVVASGEVRLVLERARSAQGSVLDARERPLAGVEVTVRPSPAGSPGEAVTVLTDDRGRFEVPTLPGDRVDLEARRQGFAPTIVPGVAVAQGPGHADLGTLTLSPGVRIEGRVVDTAGRPLAGTGVWLAEGDRHPSRELAETLRPREPDAKSDEAGRFAIVDVSRGRRVNVLLAREGYVPSWVPGVEAPTAKPLAVVLEPASRIQGRVEDESGKPVPGASVRLRPAPPPPGTVGVERRRSENSADAEAGPDGVFAFADVAPGAVTIEASAEGFLSPEPVELQVPKTGEVRDVYLVLGRGASVSGWISTPGGEPVSGARVRIGAVQTESDAEGRYRLVGIPPGLKGLVLSHPAYKGRTQEVDVQPGENRVDVALERGATVSGRVVDEAGAPRLGVSLILRNRGERGQRGYQATSGAEGRFEILAVADGSFDLEAEAAGFAPAVHSAVVEVAGRNVEGLELVLRRGATVSGRIQGLEAGQAAAVEVTAERSGRPARPGTVDHAGRYEIAALEAGDWHLRARLAEGRREADAWVAIAPSDREVERDLKLGGGLALDGLVLIEDRPLPQSRVTLRGLDVTAERGVTTDHQGTFRIEDLEPGRYRVEVVNAERMLSHNEDLELAADREIVIEIATAVLSGTVVAAGSGEAVAEALVYLQRLLGDEPGPLTTVGTNVAGSFVTASLVPGRYRLTVRGNGYAPEERIVDVEAGVAEPLAIELDPTSGLALTVLRATGEPPRWATIVVLDEAGRPVHMEEPRLSDYGRGYLQQVPPGRWTVLVKAAGSAAAMARTTVPGDPLEVTLPRGAALTVRVPALRDSRVAASLTLVSADGAPYFGINPGGFIQKA
ncbi:MAG TPA: carboxypeptidase-like regulatory domain-containing protein [Thermoanaerobaculia bacterium]|nr:carboxypeptidase-like regulatory domain-containing protein [Thermoanaerobaculia bacterium]